MACALKLMLLMLPVLSPLLVLGLQLETTASLAAAEIPRVAEKKSALLILAGLGRHIEATWPALEQAVVLPNEHAGYTFKIIFSTDAGLECHRESPKWNSRKCEEPTDPTAHLGRIRNFFGARNVNVLHDNATACLGQDRLSSRLTDDGAELHVPLDIHDHRVDEDSHPCDPWFERVHRLLAEAVQSGPLGERFERFDKVVALRPDIVLHQVLGGAHDRGMGNPPLPPPPAPPQLLLDKMCAEKPGFSIVTSAWKRRFWFHDRDVDFMHILCPGEELQTYAEALRLPMKSCEGDGKIPPLPPGFHSQAPHSDFKWGAKAWFCRFVQTFNERNVPIHNWDDSYTIDWPSGFEGSFP